MKILTCSLLAIVTLLTSVTRLHSQGYIITNGVNQVGDNTITVLQNPTSADYTGFTLSLDTENNFRFSPFADEGVRTFIVSKNDPISLQPIIALDYPELEFRGIYSFYDGDPFCLGFYTGYFSSTPGVYKDPVFGWGEFVNNNGTIQLLDSALEYGGDGIYAGTLNIIQPVPEPATWALTAVGGLLLAWRHRVKDL